MGSEAVDVRLVPVNQHRKRLNLFSSGSFFRSGTDALISLRQQRKHLRRAYPFFLLLDLTLPDLPGLQFLRQLRHDPFLRAALVFVLTNSESDEDKLAAYEHQIAGYLIKSNLGKDYCRLTELVQAYYQIVEFPEY